MTPTFILHLRPDPEFEPNPAGGYEHLVLIVKETEPETLASHLEEVGVEIEQRLGCVVGARGEKEALYVRDPDGYLIELKFYELSQ